MIISKDKAEKMVFDIWNAINRQVGRDLKFDELLAYMAEVSGQDTADSFERVYLKLMGYTEKKETDMKKLTLVSFSFDAEFYSAFVMLDALHPVLTWSAMATIAGREIPAFAAVTIG